MLFVARAGTIRNVIFFCTCPIHRLKMILCLTFTGILDAKCKLFAFNAFTNGAYMAKKNSSFLELETAFVSTININVVQTPLGLTAILPLFCRAFITWLKSSISLTSRSSRAIFVSNNATQ